MHATWILAPLLVITSLTVDLVLFSSLSDRNSWPDCLVAAVLGMAVGQVNLATVWGVLGYRHLPWRVATVVVVPIGWGGAIAAFAPQINSDYHAAATWGVHFLTQTVSLASLLVLIRLNGAVLLLDDLGPSDRPLFRWQFTLRYLFAWLTSTALALSVLKTSFDLAKLKETDFDWSGILILGLVGAMIGLAPMWLILDTRGRSKKFAVTFITALPVVSAMGVMPRFISDVRILRAVFLLWLVAGFYSVVAWTVLRSAGFRLVWFGSKKAAEVPSPPE